MKIDLSKTKTNKTKAIFKPCNTPMYLENKLRKFLRFMAKQSRERFENKVLKQMNKTTIEKFQDSKNVGSYGTVYRKLYAEFENSIKSQFSKDRISIFINGLFTDLNKYNQEKFYQNVNSQIGVDLKEILKTDGLNSFINAKTLESEDIINRYRDDTLIAYKENVFRRMNAGASLSDLYEEVKKNTGFRLNRGDLIARNEIKTFNAELTKKRALNVGAKKAMWQTVEDNRVRHCHHRFNGKEYIIGKGFYCSEMKEWQEPGEAINCRCIAIPIIEFEE